MLCHLSLVLYSYVIQILELVHSYYNSYIATFMVKFVLKYCVQKKDRSC